MDKVKLEEGKDLTLQFEKRGGLIPAIAQDSDSGEILMIGSINEEAFLKSLEIGMATFWSTSRDELWTKGLTSGDFLELVDVLVDFQGDQEF